MFLMVKETIVTIFWIAIIMWTGATFSMMFWCAFFMIRGAILVMKKVETFVSTRTTFLMEFGIRGYIFSDNLGTIFKDS